MIKTFKDIVAWQKAHRLALLIYKITEKYPKQEMFGLISQSRRCVISIASNIVEGFKRRSKKDSMHFYNMSESSLEELKYQLILARDLGYLNKDEYNQATELAEETGRLINGWKKAQR